MTSTEKMRLTRILQSHFVERDIANRYAGAFGSTVPKSHLEQAIDEISEFIDSRHTEFSSDYCLSTCCNCHNMRGETCAYCNEQARRETMKGETES